MNDDGIFMIGLISGFVTMFFIVLFSWHIEESACQLRHNVADCVYDQEDAFIPATVE